MTFPGGRKKGGEKEKNVGGKGGGNNDRPRPKPGATEQSRH